jgi:hypothetical protein
MLRCACALLAATAALLAWPAWAQDAEAEDEAAAEEVEQPEEPEEVDFNRTGPYLSLAGNWAVEEFDNTDDIDIEDAVGFNARAGYRALSWLSGEVVGEFLPKFDVDFGADSGDLMVWNVGVNVRLNLPTDLIQPYLIFGGGYLGADLSGAGAPDGWDGHGGFGRIGAGMELYPWEHVGLDGGVAYTIPTGDVEDLNYLAITWGLIYRF